MSEEELQRMQQLLNTQYSSRGIDESEYNGALYNCAQSCGTAIFMSLKQPNLPWGIVTTQGLLRTLEQEGLIRSQPRVLSMGD